jgi:hypothetical protein
MPTQCHWLLSNTVSLTAVQQSVTDSCPTQCHWLLSNSVSLTAVQQSVTDSCPTQCHWLLSNTVSLTVVQHSVTDCCPTQCHWLLSNNSSKRIQRERSSSIFVRIVWIGYGESDKIIVIRFQAGAWEIFFRSFLRPTETPIECVSEAPFPGNTAAGSQIWRLNSTQC